MDKRTALAPGTVILFPGMKCTIEKEIGRGSNAIVYSGAYPDISHPEEDHFVLIKELFPFSDDASICRDASGNIGITDKGREIFETHRLSFEYGNKIHLRMLGKYPEMIGANINTFSANGTMYTVLGCSGGQGLDHALEKPSISLKRITLWMLGILEALEAFHESEFLHLDISPDNILLIGKEPRERIMLIDYNSAWPMDKKEQAESLYFSVKQGYTSPEVRSGNVKAICAASDLYSATAVFYRCIAGSALSPFQMIRPAPPDVSNCECLKDMPETVKSMGRQILYRGLQTLPQKRYGSVSEMRKDLQELLDRIDGVGITHWALWEAGRRTVLRVVKENPALSFIRDEERLFPSNAVGADGAVRSVHDCIADQIEGRGENAIMIASGGMGKTTAILREMSDQPTRYSKLSPAMVYISLYGFKDGGTSFIRDRILENLHYKADTVSYDDARHALYELMSKPIVTREGDRPVMILFLDGWNEASGSTQALTEEIEEISRLEGVRILISTRNDDINLPFSRFKLLQLSEEDVRDILSSEGLLLPESESVLKLLETPLMLSVFIQTSRAGQKQVNVKTRDELMKAYFSTLLEKEFRGLSKDDDERWRLEAAVSYVLPAVAAEFQKRKTALSDAELLKPVEKCFDLFRSPILRHAFPEWIGHSKAIRGDSTNAEEWYGMIVHQLLWKRMGLLVKNEQGNYRTVHEIIEEYLCEIDGENRIKIRRRNYIKLGIAAVCFVVAFFGGFLVYDNYISPPLYNEAYAAPVLEYGISAYMELGREYERISDLLDLAMEQPEQFEDALERYRRLSAQSSFSNEEDAEHFLNNMLESGEVMPGSKKPLNVTCYQTLIGLVDDRKEEYMTFVDVLGYMAKDGKISDKYGKSYQELFLELINNDAVINATLYQIVCMPHISGMYAEGSLESHNLDSIMKSIYLQNGFLTDETNEAALERTLNILQGKRDEILSSIYQNGAYSAFMRESKKEQSS